MSTKDWQTAGFSPAAGTITPRLIMGLSGLEKSGKTHFALTAPAPIAYLSLDYGDEGVIESFQAEKTIYKQEFKMISISTGGVAAVKAAADTLWEKLKKAYDYALKNARTVILDTETETWEVCRLAAFGKLEQIKPHHYAPVNREYKEVIIKAAYESNANVILLERLKKEYVNDKPTGQYEQSGYTNLPYEVQINARTFVDADGRFKLYVDNCRHNNALRGMILDQDMLTFPMVANMVMPSVDPVFWS